MVPSINLIDIIEQNPSRSYIAFIPWFNRIFVARKFTEGLIEFPWSKGALNGFLRNKGILVSIALDVVVQISFFNHLQILMRRGYCRLWNINIRFGSAETRFIEKLAVVLIIELLLPEAYTRVLLERIA